MSATRSRRASWSRASTRQRGEPACSRRGRSSGRGTRNWSRRATTTSVRRNCCAALHCQGDLRPGRGQPADRGVQCRIGPGAGEPRREPLELHPAGRRRGGTSTARRRRVRRSGSRRAHDRADRARTAARDAVFDVPAARQGRRAGQPRDHRRADHRHRRSPRRAACARSRRGPIRSPGPSACASASSTRPPACGWDRPSSGA